MLARHRHLPADRELPLRPPHHGADPGAPPRGRLLGGHRRRRGAGSGRRHPRPARLRHGAGLPQPSGVPGHDVIDSGLTAHEPPPGRGASFGGGPAGRRADRLAVAAIPFVPPARGALRRGRAGEPARSAGSWPRTRRSSPIAARGRTSSGERRGGGRRSGPGAGVASGRPRRRARGRARSPTSSSPTATPITHRWRHGWRARRAPPTLAFGPHGAIDPTDDVVIEEAIDTAFDPDVRLARRGGRGRRRLDRRGRAHAGAHLEPPLLRAAPRSEPCSPGTT